MNYDQMWNKLCNIFLHTAHLWMLTCDVAHFLKISLLTSSSSGGVILLKSPVLKRGVGTNKFLWAWNKAWFCQNNVNCSEWHYILAFRYVSLTKPLNLAEPLQSIRSHHQTKTSKHPGKDWTSQHFSLQLGSFIAISIYRNLLSLDGELILLL